MTNYQIHGARRVASPLNRQFEVIQGLYGRQYLLSQEKMGTNLG